MGATGATGPQGPAGPGITWSSDTSGSVSAQPNVGYLLRAANTVVQLPTQAAVGDTVRLVGTGAGSWTIQQQAGQTIDADLLLRPGRSLGQMISPADVQTNQVSMSRDGQVIFFSGSRSSDGSAVLMISTDGAQTWRQVTSPYASQANAFVLGLKVSGNGQVLVVTGSNNSGYLDAMRSLDGGATWQMLRAAPTQWTGEIAMSDDGAVIALPFYSSGDKVARLNSVADIVKSGLVWVPQTRWAEEVVEEIAAFPFAPHDDLVDTVSMAMRHVTRPRLRPAFPAWLAWRLPREKEGGKREKEGRTVLAEPGVTRQSPSGPA